METGNLILVICVFLFVLYKFGTHNLNYWKKKGIKQLNPLPFVGDNLKAFLRKADAVEVVKQFYDPFKNDKLGGIYIFRLPFLSVTDPELLKQIMVKDAEYFGNRHDWSNNSDPLMSKNLLALKDDKWREMRAVMTTVFTSSKMKDMFCFMEKCAEQSVVHIKNKMEGKNSIEMEMREFFSRYGTDVIATTAFGVEVDSFKHPNNEFYSSGKSIRNIFSGLNLLKFWCVMALPSLARKLKLTFFSKEICDFFISLVTQNIKEREEKQIVRKDVIHILMEARKEKDVKQNGEIGNVKLPNLTDTDIAAQAIVFFFAGFESIATLLGFACYELAVNPDVQEKLYQEIEEVAQKENGITYDGVICQMTYLNMVINETLRKWPSAALSDREVSKPYVLPKTDRTPEIQLKRGDTILIPIVGFHYDPEYFPDPHKFDPERFRDEKNTITPFTFLPFGEGRRHCIGMRYATMEAKTILVHLLMKYMIVPSKKTSIPLKLSKKRGFMLDSDDGFWLELQCRK